MPTAEERYWAKVDVREILALHRADHRVVRIAERFAVSRATVSDLIAGRTWKHLQEIA